MAVFESWLGSASVGLLAVILMASLVAAAVGGHVLRERLERGRAPRDDASHESYVVTAVLGLLALLLGFTFALAVQRFDTRRALVLDEANTIGTVYLRADLLPPPHDARIREVLVRYTDSRIALAHAPQHGGEARIAADALLNRFWVETVAARRALGDTPFAALFLADANHLIDLDASRRQARRAKVPGEVVLVLYVYVTATAAMLGYVLTGRRGRLSGGIFLLLLALVLLLIFDIDRPSTGWVREGQAPMQDLRASLLQAESARLSAASKAPSP